MKLSEFRAATEMLDGKMEIMITFQQRLAACDMDEVNKVSADGVYINFGTGMVEVKNDSVSINDEEC